MILVLNALLGCTPAEEPTDSTTPATSTAETAEPIDTGWSPGDYGTFQMWTDRETGQVLVGAVAVQTTPGFVNLAECLADPNNNTTCLPQLPKAEGTFIDFDPDARVDLDLLRTRYLGDNVAFGPFGLEFIQDPDSQSIFYTGQGSYDAVRDSTFGPSWSGGARPDYEGEEDIFVTEQLEIISPEPGSFTRFTNGDQFVIEWVPRGDGSAVMTLEATSRFGFSRIFRIADDGLFALDIDSLPWTGITQEVDFVLTRWDRGEIRRFGHVIDLTASSSVTFEGEFLNVGPREPLRPANTCNTAQGLLSLPAGGWWWPFDDLTRDVTACGAFGQDAIYRVDLPSRTLLTVDYTAYGDDTDGILGIATSCPATGNTCEELINQFNFGTIPNGLDHPEFVEYFNISDRLETVYVILDVFEDPFNFPPFIASPKFFTIDAQIQALQSPELYNSCGDIPPSSSITQGVYYSQFTAYSDTLNPGPGGCTMKSAPGPDAMIPITVPANQTLTAFIEMPDADPALYLLNNCNDAFQCPAGADTGADEDETLTYSNQSGVDENLFLVIDSAAGFRPYFLSLNFN